MYGECKHHLQRRMYIAWRRKRAGSIRDRVLLLLQSEGKFTFSNRVRPSADTSESQRAVDSHVADNVGHDGSAHASNCSHISDLENAVPSHQCNISGTESDTVVCKTDRIVENGGIEQNHRLIVTRCLRKNKTNFISIRHKQAVSAYALKGMPECRICDVLQLIV